METEIMDWFDEILTVIDLQDKAQNARKVTPLSQREFASEKLTQTKILATLTAAPNNEMRQSDIASALGLSQSRVHQVVRQMIRRCLIEDPRGRPVKLGFTTEDQHKYDERAKALNERARHHRKPKQVPHRVNEYGVCSVCGL